MSKNVIPFVPRPTIYTRYAKKYVKHTTRTGSGKRPSVDINDPVATALRGMTVAELRGVARENKVDCARWRGLNPGRFRMTLGRKLRHMMKTGVAVYARGKRIKLPTKAVDKRPGA
jgi:hypothetical protein